MDGDGAGSPARVRPRHVLGCPLVVFPVLLLCSLLRSWRTPEGVASGIGPITAEQRPEADDDMNDSSTGSGQGRSVPAHQCFRAAAAKR